MPRLVTRKNSSNVPAAIFSGDQLFPPLTRWPLRTPGGLRPGILEAHPCSARRGCTSTNFIPSFLVAGMSSKLASYDGSWKSCCTKEYSLFFFSSTQYFHYPKPHQYNVVDEPVPCKLHLRGTQMVSRILPRSVVFLLSKQTKSSFFTRDHSPVLSPQGIPLKQGSRDLHLTKFTVPVSWYVHYSMFNHGNLVTWILSSFHMKVRFRDVSAFLRVTQPMWAKLGFKLR